MSGSTRAITLTLSVRDADTVKRQLEQLGPAGESALKRLEDAARKASGQNGIGGIGAAAQGASRQAGGAFALLSSQAGQLVAALGVGGGIAGALTAMVRAGDAFTGSMSRLRQATGSVQAASEVYEALYRNALQTGVSVNESVDAFQRFSIAARAIGATREQVTQLVAGLQRVAIVSGSSGQEIGSAALQLSQALASGVLQGDELRSILEAMPLLAEGLARELGVGIGQLRQMGAEGKLTNDVIFRPLLRTVENIGTQFEQAPLTVERAFGSLSVAAGRFLAQLDQAIGLSNTLARGLAGAAAALDGARRAAGGLSAEEELAQMRSRAATLGGRISELQAQQGEASLRAPANRNSLRPGAVATARTQAGGSASDDLDALIRERADLLAQIEDLDRGAATRRNVEQAEADRRAAENRRQRDTQTVDALRRTLDAEFKAREEHQKRVRDLEAAQASGAITPAERARLQGLADADLETALRRAAGGGARGGAGGARQSANDNRELNEALRDRESLLRSLETPYDIYVRRLGELAELQDRLPAAERLSNEQLDNAAKRLQDDLERAERGTERVDDTARQLGLTFTSAFEDAIIKGKDFREVLKGIGEDIARLIMRKAITEPLANAAGPLVSAAGNFLSGLFTGGGGLSGTSTGVGLAGTANALGNIFAGGNVVPFARGGVVSGPTVFPMANGGVGLMGEAGPEAIMPLQRDGSGRLGVRAQGGGGMTFNVSIDARGADAGVEQRIRVGMALAVQEAQRQFTSSINRGGAAAKTVGRRA
jgi:tape measure domain-containing protein